jgi:hypothetical protein
MVVYQVPHQSLVAWKLNEVLPRRVVASLMKELGSFYRKRVAVPGLEKGSPYQERIWWIHLNRRQKAGCLSKVQCMGLENKLNVGTEERNTLEGMS